MGESQKRPVLRQLGDIARATVFPADLASSRRRFVGIYVLRLLFLVGRRLWHDSMPRQAAALAFQTLLSLVPFAAVVFAVASTLELGWLQDKLVAFLETQLVPESASDVGRRVAELAAAVRPKALGIAGGGTLVFLSITLLFNVEAALNEIFRARKGRAIWLRAGVSLVVVLLAPLAYGLSLTLSGWVVDLPLLSTAVLPLVLTIAALFLCYWLLPHQTTRLRHAAVGALVAGVGLELLKHGFALYASRVGHTLSAVYGTFAILPLFLVWIYLAWLVFLFGAELSAALHEVRHHERLAVSKSKKGAGADEGRTGGR